MTVTYSILNVTAHPASHSVPMETIECFMFGELWDCLDIFGDIGKFNSPFIEDLIICLLGNNLLVIFAVGHKLLRWVDTAMKFPVRPESATAGFSSLSCIFVVGARSRLLHTYAF